MLPQALNSEYRCAERHSRLSFPVAAKVSVRFLPTLDIKSRHIAVPLKPPNKAHPAHFYGFLVIYSLGYSSLLREFNVHLTSSHLGHDLSTLTQ